VPQELRDRLEIIRDILRRRWVRALGSIWFLSGVWDLALSQWIPERYAKHLPKVYEMFAATIGLLPAEIWLLAGLIIGMSASLEYALKHKRQLATALTSPMSETARETQQSILPKPLEELFKTDFPGLGKKIRDLTLTFDGNDSIHCVMYVYQEFASGTEFIALYVPPCGLTSNVCDYFAHNYRKHYDELKRTIQMNVLGPGDFTHDRSADLAFSGRLYLYHADKLSLGELAEISNLLQSKGLNVKFRGAKYVADEWKQRLIGAHA